MANKVYSFTDNILTEIEPNKISGLSVSFVSGDENRVIIGNDGNIENFKVVIKGSFNTVNIGRKASIHGCTIMLHGNFNYREMSIGNFTYIGGALIQQLRDNSTVKIGEDCMLSDGINIVNDYGIKIFDLKTDKVINSKSDIYIGNHAWIGRNSFICGDTVIADNCIVGTKSFVSGQFLKSYCSIAGNPAKTVKSGIDFIKCHMDNFDMNIKNIK